MALHVQIDRIVIDAPRSWEGGADAFRQMLERALADELRAALAVGDIDAHEVLRVDVPPVAVQDVYEMQDTAREIARRIVQAVRSNPE
jgi:hypothetical protein